MSEENRYTKITNTSYGQRMGNSFMGIIFGLLLFTTGTALLYWNERQVLRPDDAISQAQLATESLPSITTIDTSFNGKMVHATGKAVTTDTLKDSVTGISVNAIALMRHVFYYQWVQIPTTQEVKNLDGSIKKTTSYTYEKKWTDAPVNSAHFTKHEEHKNTLITNLKTKIWIAQNVTFGAYTLPDFLIHAIDGAEKFTPVISTEVLQKSLFPHYAQSVEKESLVHVRQNTLYLGQEPHSPNIGDMRIVYSAKPQGNVSILARVHDNTFDTFVANNGEHFYGLDMGIVRSDTMYQKAKNSNSMLSWILRAMSIFILIIGLTILIAPLSISTSTIPLLRDILGAAAGLEASLLGMAWSCLIMTVAWILFRPMLGIGLTGAAFVIFVLLYLRGKGNTALTT